MSLLLTDHRVKALVVNQEKDFLVHKAEWPALTWEVQRFFDKSTYYNLCEGYFEVDHIY